MRWRIAIPLLLIAAFLLTAAGRQQQAIYRQANPELGIVYRPIHWDRQQWDEVFRDPATPVGWGIMPLGRESCSVLERWWFQGLRNSGMKPAILLAPFLTKNEIEKTIDCAAPLGIQRVILDEYISYHSKNLNHNLCTVISEAREIYQNAKRKYPGLELLIDDNWQTWTVDLSREQAARSCGNYPYFQYDQAGISVLSKYGNPATGQCGHPTVEEMREQIIDTEQTVRDFSRSRKIFVWQLNQHWYPGEGEVLQLFREAKQRYRWNRFLLFGPTADDSLYGNWGYQQQATQKGCFAGDYNWYLPARTYLIKMTEGRQARLRMSVPATGTRGTIVPVSGQIVSSSQGVAVQGIQLQVTPPPGSLQRFERDLVAPSKALLALIGVRVNVQLPHKIVGAAKFQLERVQLSQKGSSNNLLVNSEFDNGLNNWFVISTAPVSAESNGVSNYLQATASANQSVSITSMPAFVIPGRTYTVRFDARILQEARNNGYFFVSWYTTKEVRRDRIFMKFPEARTVMQTNSNSSGRFSFQWQPSEPGLYTISTFFPGSPAYQPSFRKNRIEIN